MNSDVIFFIAIFAVLCLVFAVFGILVHVLQLWDETWEIEKEADNE